MLPALLPAVLPALPPALLPTNCCCGSALLFCCLSHQYAQRVEHNGMQALLQQAFRKDAIRREWEQHEARLVRVATLDDAAVFRSTHSAEQQQALNHQFRRSIQMSA